MFEIQKCTLSKLLELEIQWGINTNKTKDKAKPGMNSLGIRFITVMKKTKAVRKSETETKNIIARLIVETGSECQFTLTVVLGVK